jgi:MFS family permease
VSSRPAFRLTAYVLAATMIGTTLPTPLYPAYERRFGFGALTVTVVFATYAVGVLAALLAFGRASDTIGRRPVLVAGLVLSALSSVIFLVLGGLHAHGLPLLLVGRLLSGLSAGVVTGTATAALTDFAGQGQERRAGLVAALANIGGLGSGPLLAGFLAQWFGPALRVCYVVHLGLVALALVATALIGEPVEVIRPRRLRVAGLHVPARARPVLIQAGTAGFAGFAVLGLFAAVSSALLGLLGHHDPALTGLVVFAVFLASALGQLTSARLATRGPLIGGTAALSVGIATVGVGIGLSSLAVFVGGGVTAGLGHGLTFRAALSAVTSAGPPEHRGALASSFFAICYAGISLPVVGVGAGAEIFGMVHTGEVFAALVAALSLAAMVSFARRPETGDRTAAG